jgi:hypothetical protein
MSLWLPVAEHLKNISLSGLYTFKDIIEAEISMRQESFYNEPEPTEKKSVKLEVVK